MLSGPISENDIQPLVIGRNERAKGGDCKAPLGEFFLISVRFLSVI